MRLQYLTTIIIVFVILLFVIIITHYWVETTGPGYYHSHYHGVTIFRNDSRSYSYRGTTGVRGGK